MAASAGSAQLLAASGAPLLAQQPRRRPVSGAARCRRQRTLPHSLPASSEAAAAAPPPAAAVDCSSTVDRVLQLVDGTDGGVAMSAAQRAAVDELLRQLAVAGVTQQPRPNVSPLLWGNYSVAYTSSGDQQRGQPAGGRFRGALGRALFVTAGVFQSVLAPDIATNKVAFKLFGLFRGAVGLRGKVVPVAAGEPHGQGRTAGEQDTVRVLFEPPVLSLGQALHFRIGPPSSVQLQTTYLDERVRLGLGSRGSVFVFVRGGDADAAGMADVGLASSTRAGLAGLAAAIATIAAGGWALFATQQPFFQVLAGLMLLITAALAVVVWQGGVIRDEVEIAQTQALQLKMMEQRRAAAAAAAAGQGGGAAA